MKLSTEERTGFKVILTKEEIEYIRELTINCLWERPEDEPPEDKEVRTQLFDGSMRILKYITRNDGTIIRGCE